MIIVFPRGRGDKVRQAIQPKLGPRTNRLAQRVSAVCKNLVQHEFRPHSWPSVLTVTPLRCVTSSSIMDKIHLGRMIPIYRTVLSSALRSDGIGSAL